MKKPTSTMISLITITSLVLGLSACTGAGQSQGAAPPAIEAGALTELTLEDMNGDLVRFGDHLGKEVLLISFWATHCKPCKTEMPFLQHLHDTYGDKGLKVIGISVDGPDTDSGVDPYLRTNNYTYTNVIDRQSEAATLMNSKNSLPYLVIFDKTGKMAEARDGFTPGDKPMLEKKLKELLGL